MERESDTDRISEGAAPDYLRREISAPFPEIEKYRMVDCLGEGGMGIVYLAEQSEPIRRLVVVKVVKPDADIPAVMRRFNDERQSLARMSHPNIMKILAAGSTNEHLPYFVMEYVAGGPITRFCATNNVPLRERLQLVIEVCDAIQHAHQKNVIHCDLNPNNILVTREHGQLKPKLIDFGLGMPVPRIDTESEVDFVYGAVGTPPYTSPEQHGWGYLDIDTRTDVFSIGAVLYELVCGSLPDDFQLVKSGKMDKAEVQKLLLPSEHVARTAYSEMVQSRGFRNIRQLQHYIRGDLDAVIMKAIAIDRNDRYQTPTELAHDLQRFLDHYPVAARKQNRWQLLQKFYQRNRPASIVGMIGFVFIFALSVVVLVQMNQMHHDKLQAELAAARHRHLQSIITDSFTLGDPGSGAGQMLSARELMLKVAQRIGQDKTHASADQALFMAVAGEFYFALDMNEQAEDFLRRALREATALKDEQYPTAATIQARLGQLLITRGQFDEAEVLLQQAVDTLHRQFGDGSVETLQAELWQAQLYLETGRLEHVRESNRHVRENIERLSLQNEEVYVWTLFLQAESALAGGDFAAAETHYIEALAAAHAVLGKQHAWVQEIKGGLSYARQSRGNLRGAEALQREMLQDATTLFGADSIIALAHAVNLALNLTEQQRHDEALALLQPAHALLAEKFGRDYPRTLDAEFNLAYLYLQMNRPAEARALFQRQLDRHVVLYGPDDLRVANDHNMLGRSYQREGLHLEALPHFEQALAIFESELGEHWRVAAVQVYYADSLAALGEQKRAEALFAQAIALLQQTFGAEHQRVQDARARRDAWSSAQHE